MDFKTNLANRNNYGGQRSLSDIKYLVIHYTAVDGDTDESEGKAFHNQIVEASAHRFVDSDSTTQSVPDDYVAWSVGGSKYKNNGGRLYGVVNNYNSLSIELCDDFKNGTIYPSTATIQNALELTRMLMKQYNIPKENVIRHYDVNGKPCPAYWVDDDRWHKEFYDLIDGSVTPSVIPSTSTVPFVVRILKDGYNVRKHPAMEGQVVMELQKGAYTIVELGGNNNGWGFLKSGAGWIYLGNTEYVQKVDANPIPSTPVPTPTPKPTVPSKVNVTYQVRCSNGKTYSEVTNSNNVNGDGYAGVDNSFITDLTARVDYGKIEYQVHVLGGNWLPYVSLNDWNNPNGFAGIKKPIDGVRAIYSGIEGKKARVRVMVEGRNTYCDYVYNANDYAGIYGKRIKRLQMDIV